jgi:hypothetical protein
MKYPENMGVKGMFPLGCLPLWGREGDNLITFSKKQNGQHQDISTEPKITGS